CYGLYGWPQLGGPRVQQLAAQVGGEPVAHRPLRPGLPDRQKRVPDRARPLGSPSQTTLQSFVSVPSGGRLSQSKASVEAVNAIAYATRYHSDWFWRGAQHVRKWRRSH